MSFARRQRVINMLLKQQGGHCAFCSNKLYTVVIDHDHVTDLVRGLLCESCNTAEGRLIDDPDWIAYRLNTPAMKLGIEVDYWTL